MFAIVMDSTSSTPTPQLAEMGVRVVPLMVRFGNDEYIDGETMLPADFYRTMIEKWNEGLPKTACPAIGSFEGAYREVFSPQDVEGVLVITMSAGLSETNNVARLAAANVDFPVEVIDAKAVSMDLSFIAEKAAALRDAGASLDAAAKHLRAMAEECVTFYALDTLDNLIAGGRLGKAAGMAAGLLKIKPLLSIEKEEGEAINVGKARGAKGAIRDIAKLVADYQAEHGELEVRFAHGNAADRIPAFAEAIQAQGVYCNLDKTGWIGSVIGTYAGNGAVAACCCPKALL